VNTEGRRILSVWAEWGRLLQCWREAQSQYPKERSFEQFSIEEGISRLGEFYTFVLIVIAWFRNVFEVWKCKVCHLVLISSRLWKFPETAWWRQGSYQATHAPEPKLWVSSMNRLAAKGDLPGGICGVASFVCFSDWQWCYGIWHGFWCTHMIDMMNYELNYVIGGKLQETREWN